MHVLPLDIAYPLESLMILLAVPLVIWSIFWKIVGLWFAARKDEKRWFIVFVFINLAGILELYYLNSRKCWPFKHEQ